MRRVLLDAPRIPYYGMQRRTRPDRELIKRAVRDVAASDQFILKSRVASFERALCERVGAGHAVAVSSGTAAVQVAVAALGAGPGDEVVVPAFGFHSSVSAVVRLGATPVLVDVEPDTWLVGPDAVGAALGERTAGVLAVHLFSAMADMPSLERLAAERGAWLLENAAVALGMGWGGRAAGSFGDAAVFSFQPVKPLGGVSDGGAIVTRDEDVARRCRMLRNHGQDGVNRFLHHRLGWNARMDELNATVLEARLARYDDHVRRRAEIARRYDEAFAGLAPELRTPPAVPHERVFYTYVVASERRDELERHLAERGIESVVYYPLPLHLQPAFRELGHARGDFPNAERACEQALSLPLYPDMPDEDVEATVEAVLEFHA